MHINWHFLRILALMPGDIDKSWKCINQTGFQSSAPFNPPQFKIFGKHNNIEQNTLALFFFTNPPTSGRSKQPAIFSISGAKLSAFFQTLPLREGQSNSTRWFSCLLMFSIQILLRVKFFQFYEPKTLAE